jgi:hypothetical protein
VKGCSRKLCWQKMSFNGKRIRGVLLDITGVLMESSSVEDTKLAIPGSVEAVQKLNSAGSSLPIKSI